MATERVENKWNLFYPQKPKKLDSDEVSELGLALGTVMDFLLTEDTMIYDDKTLTDSFLHLTSVGHICCFIQI